VKEEHRVLHGLASLLLLVIALVAVKKCIKA